MIDTGAFKTAIVDLAVTGQLSAQFRADDSVEEIIAALPPLSNKRKKLLGQSFEYGKQASLPDHWRWICLGEISSYGDTPTKAYFDDVSGDTWLLDLEDIRSGGQIIKKTRVHGKKFIGDKTVFSEGQVLYSKLRPYLKKVLVADEGGISTPELISFDTYGGVIPQYVVYCLLSSFTDRAIEKRSYGIKMPRIDAAFMVNLPIPVPPVSEQHFIVDRVQEAFSQIDTIDGLQAQYADNLAVLKGKLIDAAIQGKLTEQLPEDGTAEELYHRVQAKKQALIESGRIKREKPLPTILDDDVPYDIPKTWKWIHWGDVVNIVSARRVHQADWRESGVPFYRAREIAKLAEDGFVNNELFISEELYSEFSKSGVPQENDLMVSAVGTLGRTYVVKATDRFYYKDASVLCFENFGSINPHFLAYVMKSDLMRQQIENNSGGTTVDTLTMVRMVKYLLPLPPRAEQDRIVNALNEALVVINA